MIKQSATYGEWKIDRHDDDKIEVYKNGELCASAASALREISQLVGFEENPNWNTRQFGSKLVKFLCENAPAPTSEQTSEPKKESTPSAPSELAPKDEPEPESEEIDPVWYEVPDGEYFDIQRKIRENIDREKILNELKHGHEKGDVRATMILAKLYGSLGKLTTGGGEKERWNLFLELAEKGNLYAISMLTYAYKEGKYLEKDETLAIICDICTDFMKDRKNRPDVSIWKTIEWITKKNRAGFYSDPEYDSILAKVMKDRQEKRDVPKIEDSEKFFDVDCIYYELTDENTQNWIEEQLEKHASEGLGLPESPEWMVNALEEAHKQGDFRASAILAAVYYDEKGLNDKKKAIKLYQELAERGNISAFKILAKEYESGDNVEKDFALARACNIYSYFMSDKYAIKNSYLLYSVKTHIKPSEDQYVEVVDKYNNDIEEKRLKYNELVADYNKLLEEKKQISSKCSGSVSDYNNLLDKYNKLMDERNELVRDYNNLLDRKNSIQSKYESLQDDYADLQSKYSSAQSRPSRPSADDIVKVRVMYLKRRTIGWNTRETKIVEMTRRDYKQLAEGSMKNRIAYVNNKFKNSWNIDGLEEVHVELV